MWHYETNLAENQFQQAVVLGMVSTHPSVLQLMSKPFEDLNGEIIKYSDSFPFTSVLSSYFFL